MQTWRLILDGPDDGAWNMAVDRAVLRARRRGEVPATLRLTAGSHNRALGAPKACRRHAEDANLRSTSYDVLQVDGECSTAMRSRTRRRVRFGRDTSMCNRQLSPAVRAHAGHTGVSCSGDATGRARGEGRGGVLTARDECGPVARAAKLSGSARVWDHDAVLQHAVRPFADIVAGSAGYSDSIVGTVTVEGTTATQHGRFGDSPSPKRFPSSCLAFESDLGVRLQTCELTVDETLEGTREGAASRYLRRRRQVRHKAEVDAG